ncbi:hypothetical protein KP509_24G044200 [Ceratopteris richardii]|uniref:MPN domain-containing protein n=1 Tax=Ceratopteris richardii TaxID=49495 RepID=A0A8T2RUH2_CERRI|nr:hypothetical protein KP509_24G044200 [Ceratopteris richardii]
MSLTCAKISEEVWLTCVTHALSTETEEIMGLLFGDIEYSDDGQVVALVWGAAPQTRSDRRKDRVETNPEQLAAASAQAERLSAETGKMTRVIGWYHSHPHITVLPSHVDVRTQGMYQLLDAGFLGLIFSCFNEDSKKVGKIQATAFQVSSGWQQNKLHNSFQQFTGNAQDLSSDSEKDALRTAALLSSSPHLNSVDVVNVGILSTKESISSQPKVIDLEDHFLDAGMQEAMHLSNLEMSGAEYMRREVPFEVVPGHTLVKANIHFSSFVSLQRMLFDEEQAAYNQSLAQSRRDDMIHPLTAIHHSATYEASLCKLMEYCLSPALSSLWDRLEENNIRLEALKEENMNLHLQTLPGGQSTRQSPHPSRRKTGSMSSETTNSSSSGQKTAGDKLSPREGRRK